MTFLNLTLSILGILFVIWLYAFVFAKNIPTLNFNDIQNFWNKFRKIRFTNIPINLFRKMLQFLSFVRRILNCIWKFIAELTVEIVFHMILRGIWWLIKSLFVLLGKIFN